MNVSLRCVEAPTRVVIDIEVGKTKGQTVDIFIIRVAEIGPQRCIAGELVTELLFDRYARINHGLHRIVDPQQERAVLWCDGRRIVEDEIVAFRLYDNILGYWCKPFRGKCRRGLIRELVFDSRRNGEW